MIKLPLIALLLFCAAYGWRQRPLSPAVGILTPLMCAAGIALVLRPDWSSDAARILGVGRGADLVLYIWTAISILVLANIHFRLRSQHAMITVLTREVAILETSSSESRRLPVNAESSELSMSGCRGDDPAPRGKDGSSLSSGGWSAPRLFLLIAPLLYAAYALVTPPFQTFDESQHLYRAWQIASLQLTSERRGAQSGGELPPGLAPATLHEIGSVVPQGWRGIRVQPVSEMFGWNTPVRMNRPRIFYNFYGAAVYSPVGYMPQVIAVRIGEAAGLSVEWTLRLGRLLNSALCIALIVWALTLLPFGRWVMMTVALLPATAAAAASFGQDGLVIGGGFLLTAVGLKVATERRWSSCDLVIAALAGVAVTMSKYVYLPLVAIAAVPIPAGVAWRRWLSAPLFVAFLGSLATFAWLRLNANSIVTFRPSVPPIPEQVSWALNHPIGFCLLIVRTYMAWMPLAWASLYDFGDSTVPTVWAGAVAGLAAVVEAIIYGEPHAPDLTRGRRAWMLVIFAVVSVLIATALFLTVSPRGAVTIEGIQGRYFLPMAPLATIALIRRGAAAPPYILTASLAFALMAHLAVLGTIVTTFYSL